jgi:hypothetical protein
MELPRIMPVESAATCFCPECLKSEIDGRLADRSD